LVNILTGFINLHQSTAANLVDCLLAVGI